MNTKSKVIYVCQQCGAQSPKWSGRCGDCGGWNTLVEERVTKRPSASAGYLAESSVGVVPLTAVNVDTQARLPTTIGELDRVLGGGLVAGSTVLVGGDPGIGKSTLLLQALCRLGQQYKVLYVTGEESLQQIALRAQRLELPRHQLWLLAETQVDRVVQEMVKERPAVIVIDSIQTMAMESIASAPGSVGQIRESTAELVRYAKQSSTALFIVGHVTKEGTLAGPKVLEHMVDCVLYFEGDRDSRFRVVRAIKNRFGAVNELGIFAMTDRGLREVTNPSAIFLANHEAEIAGSAIMVTREGSRSLLVEIQALVDKSYLANPRRVTVGLDSNRLSILLAVLHRHGGIPTYDQDVFINVVGGVRITETAVDLALLLAVFSSIRGRPLARGLVAFGEVGLAGELRPVQNGQERIRAAIQHGFRQVLIPKANAPRQLPSEIEVITANTLIEALQSL